MGRKSSAKYDEKATRMLIVRQIKAQVPAFSRLPRDEKREIVQKTMRAIEKHLRDGTLDVPPMEDAERLNLQQPLDRIISLDKLQTLLERHHQSVLPFPVINKRHISDSLLKVIDGVLDDSFLNANILKPIGGDYSKRDWLPAQLLRFELLRTALYPEFSCRKFCSFMASKERKQERAFCGLPLHNTHMCDHSRLSRFRYELDAAQRINLMVYIIHKFIEAGCVNLTNVYALDASDIQTSVDTKPLMKLELPDGKVVRIYSDIDCDCGPRRSKRNKSRMYVGYKLHTLCICDASKGIAFPLLSFLSAANHHDSQILLPMMKLAEAVGLEIKFLAADEAYADKPKQQELLDKGISVVTPPESKAKTKPQAVDEKGQVFFDELCENPMEWSGYDTECQCHCFVCSGCEACPRFEACPKERNISIDTKFFGPVPRCSQYFDDIINQRKHAERPFNLIKHMDGLEPCRMRSMDSISTQATLSQIVGLFKVMAKLRAQPKKKKGGMKSLKQQEFQFVRVGA